MLDIKSIDKDTSLGIIAHNTKIQKQNIKRSQRIGTHTVNTLQAKTQTFIVNRGNPELIIKATAIQVPPAWRRKTRENYIIIKEKCGSEYRINSLKEMFINDKYLILIANTQKHERFYPIYLTKKAIAKIYSLPKK